MDCDICGAPCVRGLAAWHFVCTDCRTEHATLSASLNSGDSDALDEVARASGLVKLRRRAYDAVLNTLHGLDGTTRHSVLDVGSAHGWFLDAAADRFDHVVGIEPDDRVRSAPMSDRVSVRAGYFPDALHPGETFDVIVFNDVFEHIPAARSTAHAVAQRLKPNGVVIITLPVHSGFFYRLSKRLAHLGIARPFERMWQCGFPSPHRYYFSQDGLVRLFAPSGLHLVHAIRQRAIALDGLWQRIRYAEPNRAAAACIYGAAVATLPLLRLLPEDTATYFFMQKEPASARAASPVAEQRVNDAARRRGDVEADERKQQLQSEQHR